MRRRTGFTLVEVLVAMALTLFIMSILSAAFVAATQSVSDLKSAGDLAERLRGAANVLRRDLAADHFTDSAQSSVHLRDPNFWSRLNSGNTPVGFFRIYEGQSEIPAYTAGALAGNEGTDLDGFPSYYQTTTALHYTIALHGSYRSDFLSAAVPANSPLTTAQSPPTASDNMLLPTDARYQDTPNVYNSQYAEVVVFLAQNGDLTDSSNGLTPQPLYSLYRRQFLTVPQGWSANPAISQAQALSNYPEMSISASSSNPPFNSMQDLTIPSNRFELTGQAGVPPATGYQPVGNSSDLLLSDVVSFDVRVFVQAVTPNGTPFQDVTSTGTVLGPQAGTDFEDLFQLTNPNRTDPQTNQPWFYSLNNNGFSGAMVFDSWSNQGAYANWKTPGSATSVPLYQDNNGNLITIKALQITLRVWDFKTKKTRQVTMVQQM